MAISPPRLTTATWYQIPVEATVVLRTVVGWAGLQPLPPPAPRQNQKRLSACFSSRQPSLLTAPDVLILSTRDMSPGATPLPGGSESESKLTQRATVKSPPETCRLDW